MNNTLRPTGLLLVGAIFICLCLTLLAQAAESQADLPNLKKEMAKSLSGNLDQPYGSSMGKLRVAEDTIKFPWSQRQIPSARSRPSNLIPRSSPSREMVSLDEANPSKVVSDLTAINCVREREILYDGTQSSDSESQALSNSLEVSVTGQDDEDGISWGEGGRSADNIERVVDDALNSGLNGKRNASRSAASSGSLGNNMIIDVSGISVSAINTVKGGSATATSNIVIRPVQIITCPSEGEEKLK